MLWGVYAPVYGRDWRWLWLRKKVTGYRLLPNTTTNPSTVTLSPGWYVGAILRED